MKNNLLFSRFLYAFIALFCFACPALARDCSYAPFSSYSPQNASVDPMLRVSTRASATDDIRVLPESFSLIDTADVANKSPSIGAKSVGFWGHVGEWFEKTAVSIQKDPIQVAWFALGFVPILSPHKDSCQNQRVS